MDQERLKKILLDFEKNILDFMRKHNINHDEYREATKLLVSSIKEGEESLLPDVFFEAQATNIGNSEKSGSHEAIEGPFYIPGSPVINNPGWLPMRPDEAGEALVFKGRVLDVDGTPIKGATVDLWHADAAGLYSNIHPGIPEWNLRGQLLTDDCGRYEFRTILPPPYEIPKHGSTGKVLAALGRHVYRPAHLHVKVRHPAYGEMTSQLYFEGGDYLDSDVAGAVRDDLIARAERREAQEGIITLRGLQVPYFELAYDFFLSTTNGARPA